MNIDLNKNNVSESMPLISIIIPVYKVERYLKRCVDSVVSQSYRNIEIILVDDGSPDNCGKICDEYAKADSRIKVIHKENGGQSSARNSGLDLSNGEYIGFVDSDDYIDSEMYETLLKLSLEHNADIVECECRAGKSENFSVYGKNDHTVEIYSNLEAIEKFYFGEQINGLTSMVWDKLYKRHLFDKVRFYDGYNIREDANITPKLFYHSDKIIKYNYNMYNYCIESPDSSSLSISMNKFYDPVVLMNDLKEFYDDINQPMYSNFAYAMYVGALLECEYYSFLVDDKKINSIVAKELKCIRIDKSNDEFIGKGIKLKYLLYKISPFVFHMIMRLYKKMGK